MVTDREGFLVKVEHILEQRGIVDILINHFNLEIEYYSKADKEKLTELEAKKDRLIHEKNVVDSALKVLDDTETRVIQAKYLERREWQDVAAQLGCSYSWCMKVKKRAFEKIGGYL